MKNEINRYNKRIRNFKKRVNPKIAKDISNIMKPYWNMINKSSDYYKLRTLDIDVDKISVGVKENVQRLLHTYKLAASAKIEEKIKHLYPNDIDFFNFYKTKNIADFLKKHKIDSIYYSILYNAIYGKMMINMGIEDFLLITNNTKKAKFYSFELGYFDNSAINRFKKSRLKLDRFMKSKLKGMSNAILILTGNKETTLDELDFVWSNALKYLPKDGKTSFAYKIDNVEKMQLNLMAVK